MELTVLVHPIDTVAHPTIPPGFRWAVYVGIDWPDMMTCLNAGWCPTQYEAAIEGEAARVVGARVAMLCSVIPSTPPTFFLDADPIPSGCDIVTFA